MSYNYAGNYNYNYNYASNYNYGVGGQFSNTPQELGIKPWTLDYTPDQSGEPDLPRMFRQKSVDIPFTDADWDKSLFAIRALQELGAASAVWTAYDQKLKQEVMPAGSTNAGKSLLLWSTGNANERVAFFRAEIDYLFGLMQDDRDRYLPEIAAQADGAPFYILGLMDLDTAERPWTAALTHIAARFGEMLAMYFKYEYQRVRPSVVCPGLLPPFGPPRHASFPSGHSTQAHMVARMLLLIPGVKDRYGDVTLNNGAVEEGELPWLADRIAKNRERLGVHYPSDSLAGSLLAGYLVNDLVAQTINSGVFDQVLNNARNEW